MARGNCIIISPIERIKDQRQGYVKTGQTFYPGMIVQIDPSVALKGGLHTYEVYNRDADGDQPKGAFWVVTELLKSFVGRTVNDAYAAGELFSMVAPQAGDELNLLLLNIAGTADDHTVGEILVVDDGTGKLIATTGSPETEVAVLKESVTDPTSDTLVWCEWSGH